jgi:hypothetical protein
VTAWRKGLKAARSSELKSMRLFPRREVAALYAGKSLCLCGAGRA